jgi:hypothetical protein
MTRKESQRKLGDERIAATNTLLVEAIGRMRDRKTRVLKHPFAWSRQNLAREAGVDESTLYRKSAGKHVYAAVLAAFAGEDPTPSKTGLADRQNALIESLKEENRKLRSEVASLTKRLFAIQDSGKSVV